MLIGVINDQSIAAFNQEYTKEEKKKWADKNLILCPVCRKPFEYCHGVVKTPYFRHKDKSVCEDKYSESETEEHMLGKIALYNWIKKQRNVTDVILEGWIPETKQRPDIMFKKNGIQYVIEYQCSPISGEYYERHDLYRAAGIKDIWICGTEKYMSSKETRRRIKVIAKESKIYFDVNGFYVPSYSYSMYGLNRSMCQIVGEHTLYDLPIEQAVFNTAVDIAEEIKNEWLSVNEKKLLQEQLYNEKYREADWFIHSFCLEHPEYEVDKYEKLTVIKKTNNKKGIRINILAHDVYLINKKFYKENYTILDGEGKVTNSKWRCDVTKTCVPDSRYKELRKDWFLSLCETYL